MWGAFSYGARRGAQPCRRPRPYPSLRTFGTRLAAQLEPQPMGVAKSVDGGARLSYERSKQ